MPTVEITAQYVNPVKQGKKYGSVKTAEGTKYLAQHHILQQIGTGQVRKVSYHVENWKEGPVDIIDSFADSGGGGVAPSPVQTTPPVRARTAPADSKQIFVTALLKEFIAAGKVETSKAAVVSAGNALKSAYDDLFGNAKIQNSQAEMDEEIPF